MFIAQAMSLKAVSTLLAINIPFLTELKTVNLSAMQFLDCSVMINFTMSSRKL